MLKWRVYFYYLGKTLRAYLVRNNLTMSYIIILLQNFAFLIKVDLILCLISFQSHFATGEMQEHKFLEILEKVLTELNYKVLNYIS